MKSRMTSAGFCSSFYKIFSYTPAIVTMSNRKRKFEAMHRESSNNREIETNSDGMDNSDIDMGSFKFLKQINDRTKMSVFGYIREMQTKLTLPEIPMVICYLCLAYKSHADYFDPDDENELRSDTRAKLSKDRLTLTNVKTRTEEYDNALHGYGHQIIPSNKNIVATWKVKVNSVSKVIHSLNDDEWRSGIQFHFFTLLDDYDYGHNIFGFESSWVGRTYVQLSLTENLEECNCDYDIAGVGDILTIVLDTNEKRVLVKINDSAFHHVFKNIPIGDTVNYRLAVKLPYKGDSVSIIDFELYKLE